MKKELTLFEVSDDKPIKEWAAILMAERHEEARATLNEEGLLQETLFYIELDGKKYIIFYQDGEAKPSDQTKEINQTHRKILKSIKIRRIDANVLYDLDVRN